MGDVTRILLTESSIDAEATNNKGRNPLHILANFGRPETSVEIFQLFMECMPEYPLNQSDAEGNTDREVVYNEYKLLSMQVWTWSSEAEALPSPPRLYFLMLLFMSTALPSSSPYYF